MILATGAEQWIIKIKIDMIAHLANAPNIWSRPATMVVAVGPVHSLQMHGPKSDTVACRRDSMDAFKRFFSFMLFSLN